MKLLFAPTARHMSISYSPGPGKLSFCLSLSPYKLVKPGYMCSDPVPATAADSLFRDINLPSDSEQTMFLPALMRPLGRIGDELFRPPNKIALELHAVDPLLAPYILGSLPEFSYDPGPRQLSTKLCMFFCKFFVWMSLANLWPARYYSLSVGSY